MYLFEKNMGIINGIVVNNDNIKFYVNESV